VSKGKPHTPAQRAALAARVIALRSEDPPVTYDVIKKRLGVGANFVSTVLREAKNESQEGETQ